jgi:hypothetical protein
LSADSASLATAAARSVQYLQYSDPTGAGQRLSRPADASWKSAVGVHRQASRRRR